LAGVYLPNLYYFTQAIIRKLATSDSVAPNINGADGLIVCHNMPAINEAGKEVNPMAALNNP
jgi:hypothetical protein